MLRFNNRRCLQDSYKYALVLIGFLLIFQDVHIVPTEAQPQNVSRSGFLHGILQPTTIVGNVVRGVGQTIQNLIPRPLRTQQKSTTTPLPPTTKTITTITTPSSNTSEINLFQLFWNIFQTNTSETITEKTQIISETITERTQIISATAIPKSSNLFGGIFNIISGVLNPFNVLKSRTKTEITPKIIPTTTPIPVLTTGPGLIGGIFGEFGKMFGLAPTTTTTTLYPPPRGGRGFSGLIYNIVNIFRDFFDLARNALLINEDWVPGYISLKLKDVFESIKAEIEIFLQSDQPGGLGEIWKSILAIWKDFSQIIKQFISGDPGVMIAVPLKMAGILQNIGKLTNELTIKFPTTTLAPGVKSKVNERIKLNEEEIAKVLNHTATMVQSLLHIEEIVQEEFPKSRILKILGHFRLSFTKALNDSKTYGKPFVLNLLQRAFPNKLLAKYISDFGKILNKMPILSNFTLIKTVSNLLNQEFFINIGLTMVQAFINPFIANIEKLFEEIIANIVSGLIGLDPDHFILRIIDTLNNRFLSFGTYLEKFQNLEDKVKLNFTEGDVFDQIVNITIEVLSGSETQDFVRETVAQITKIIPLDFAQDSIHGINSVITDGITFVIRFFSRSLQTIFNRISSESLNVVNMTTINPTTS